MARWTLALLATLALLGASSAVWADTGTAVIVLHADAPRPGLIDSLRIQLPPGTKVSTDDLPAVASLVERVRRARELCRQSGAALALWIEAGERRPNELEVILYVVGRHADRALIEVARVHGATDEELDRALALKVGALLDAVIERRDALSAAVQPAQPPAKGSATTGEGGLSAALVAEVGGFGATGAATAGPQAGGFVSIGAQLRSGSWFLEGFGTMRLTTPLVVGGPLGVLEADEVDVCGGLRTMWVYDRYHLGVLMDLGGRLVRVDGVSARGTSGSVERAVPMFLLGPELGVALVPWLRLRSAMGVEIALRRQRFAVNGEALLDLGRARGVIEVGLLATVP